MKHIQHSGKALGSSFTQGIDFRPRVGGKYVAAFVIGTRRFVPLSEQEKSISDLIHELL